MVTDLRLSALRRWLDTRFAGRAYTLASASADASFRRYFRISFADGAQAPLVAMDAPPDKEDCRRFLQVARLFRAAGVHVPQVHAENPAEGFVLLEDLGVTTYLAKLDAGNAATLYAAAIDALVRIQTASRSDQLAPYDAVLLERELRLFPDWYVARQLGAALPAEDARVLEDAFGALLADNLAQPRVYVHRDYHSRNLMVCEDLPGVLDFQDAVYGPITYDLVSLLKDAYIRWDDEQVLDWCVLYWKKARKAGLPVRDDFAEFCRDFEWMGVQRHLKVAGIFARLAHRDGKQQYLADIALVLDYLHKACGRYRALAPLAALLERLHERSMKIGAARR